MRTKKKALYRDVTRRLEVPEALVGTLTPAHAVTGSLDSLMVSNGPVISLWLWLLVKERELCAGTIAHAISSNVDLVVLLRRLVVEPEVRLSSLVRLSRLVVLSGFAHRRVVIHLPVSAEVLRAVLIPDNLGDVLQRAIVAMSGALIVVICCDVIIVEPLTLVRDTALGRSCSLACSWCTIIFEFELVASARACLDHALDADR